MENQIISALVWMTLSTAIAPAADSTRRAVSGVVTPAYTKWLKDPGSSDMEKPSLDDKAAAPPP
jgi:hypothetical protein